MDATSRNRLLDAAGLAVLGAVPDAGGISPLDAWKAVVHGDVRPDVVVSDDEDGYLDQVDRQWTRLVEREDIVAADGTFLIHVAGPGSSALSWALVRPASELRLAQTLVQYPGEPEFLTMATDGHALCGVTTEEHGVWLTGVSFHARRGDGT